MDALQLSGTLVPDGVGGAYCGFDDASHFRCYVQHLQADGTYAPLYGPGARPVSDPAFGGLQESIVIASDRLGGVYAAWMDSRGGGSGNIWAQHFDGDLPTGVVASLVVCETAPDHVHLVWSSEYRSSCVIERRSETIAWRELGHASADGSGRISYTDGDVVPGARYAYRLRFGVGDSLVTAEEWATVPSFALALAGFSPNPALAGSASIAFTLPYQAAGQLAAYDVAGRAVLHVDISGLGPGRHTVNLGIGRAGVYWIRLIHGTRQLTSKGILIR
jgi:hypothetical protein